MKLLLIVASLSVMGALSLNLLSTPKPEPCSGKAYEYVTMLVSKADSLNLLAKDVPTDTNVEAAERAVDKADEAERFFHCSD